MKKSYLLAPIVTMLETQGIEVYTNDKRKEPEWLYFTKNNRIGYIQISLFHGLEITTVHKPNFRTGTGVLIYRGSNPPLDIFYKAMLGDCWLENPGEYYKSWENFLVLKKVSGEELERVIIQDD